MRRTGPHRNRWQLYNQSVPYHPPSELTLKRRIKRSLSEIEEIESHFYGTADKDLANRAYMTELRRKNVVRTIVLELHTALEDLLTDWLKVTVLGQRQSSARDPQRNRSSRRRLLDELLDGDGSIGFDRKLKFMRVFGIITKRTYDRLKVLNTLRNKCGHNWELNVPVRRGKRPRQLKPPLLPYGGGSLFEVSRLKDFIAEYGQLYFRLFLRSFD